MKNGEQTPRPPSKKAQKALSQIVEAAQARQYQEQEQVLGLRPLILCGLPLQRREEP
jgi:hypothetical protein